MVITGFTTNWVFKSSLVILVSLLFVSKALCATIKFQQTPCNGSLAECNEAEEMLMDSEINRRILATQAQTINYNALKANQAVCGNARGTSYTALQVVSSSLAATTKPNVVSGFLPHHQLGRPCSSSTGLLEECGGEYDIEEEFQMDSEINRRILAGISLIDPRALNANMAVFRGPKGKPYHGAYKGECTANAIYNKDCT